MNANKQGAGGEVTNPDNVGGLPPLPESLNSVYIIPREGGVSVENPFSDYYSVDQMRAYGELCRAAPAGAGEVDEAEALREFTEYFVKNYPGPHTVIMDPNWHAPKIFRAAKRALLRKLQRPTEEDAYVIEQMGRLLAEIAIIVNGPEPAMTRWSYHDLPEKVRKLQQGAGEGREGV